MKQVLVADVEGDPELERAVYRVFDRLARGRYDGYWSNGMLVLEFKKGTVLNFRSVGLKQLQMIERQFNVPIRITADLGFTIFYFGEPLNA